MNNSEPRNTKSGEITSLGYFRTREKIRKARSYKSVEDRLANLESDIDMLIRVVVDSESRHDSTGRLLRLLINQLKSERRREKKQDK